MRYRLVLSALSVKINTLFYFALAKEPLRNVILKSEFSLRQLRNEDHWKFEAFSFFELFWTSGPVWGKGLFQDLHLSPYRFHPMAGQQKWQRQGDKQIFTKDINFFFFQFWTLRKNFLFLGKEIKSAQWNEIKVLIDASCLSIPALSSQEKVPKEKAQCPERAFGFVFQHTGHGNKTHLDLSGYPKSGSPNITNTTSWYIKAVNCSLH